MLKQKGALKEDRKRYRLTVLQRAEVLERAAQSKESDANETLNSNIVSCSGEQEMEIQMRCTLKFAKKKLPDSPMPLFVKGVECILHDQS